MILQSCQATQLSGEQGVTKWYIKDNKDNVLWELPKHLNEHEVMDIIQFGREFEKKGYEQGKSEVADFWKKRNEAETLNYKAIIRNLEQENLRLATIIEDSDIFKED